MKETKKLVDWLVNLKYEDLPEDVIALTKNFILDDIGCMIGGSLQLANKALVRDAITSEDKKQSTVACFGLKTTMPMAAMINGAFIAGWDYDSMAADGGGHMGSQTASLMAVGENTKSSGKELILAECAGIEAQCRIGRSALVRHKGIGGGGAYPWHSNTSLGPFAAAVTAGKLLKFDANKMENAVAIVTSNTGGNYQHYFSWGSSVKRARCGIGAWSGVRAALMADCGITGPSESLEGELGYLDAVVGYDDKKQSWYDASKITESFNELWNIRSYNTKAGGCGCVTTLQCPVLTAIEICKENKFSYKDIASVEVQFKDDYGLQQAAQNKGTCLGETPEQRLGTSGWSLQWMVAEAIVVGMPGIREQLNNIKPYGKYKDIEELSEKVFGTVNPQYYEEHFKGRPHHKWGGRVIITMNDGTVYEHEPVTHPGCRLSGGDKQFTSYVGAINTISTDQLISKFVEQATVVGFSKKRQEMIIDFILHLEEKKDISELVELLVKEPQ